MAKTKAILLGDAMIPVKGFQGAWDKYLAPYGDVVYAGDWEPSWDQLQYRRLEVEKRGPEIEPCEPLVLEHGKDHRFDEHPCFVEHRAYGSVNFSFFRKPDNNKSENP